MGKTVKSRPEGGAQVSTRSFGVSLAVVALLLSSFPGITAARGEGWHGPAGVPQARLHGMVNPLLQEQVLRLLNTRRHFLRDQQAAPLVPVEVTSTSDVSGAIHSVGGKVEADVAGRVISAQVLADRVDELAGRAGVVELYPSVRLRPALDQSVPEIRANQAWNLTNQAGLPERGSHVLVGIVDSGIDYHNPDFKNADGSTRIKYIWDQTQDGKAPAGFNFGYECDSVSINSGQCPEKDTDGHGTHVSGIAAGNGLSSYPPREIGVAPQADIIVVKSDLDTDKIIAAWKYLVARARQLGEPIVINNSFGGQFGPHDGTEPDDRAIDALSGPGVVFVAAAGNEGNQGMHADGTVVQGGTSTQQFDAHGAFAELALGLFYSAKDDMAVTLTNTVSGETFGPVEVGQKINAQMSADKETQVTIDATPYDATHNSVLVDLDRSAAGDPLSGEWRLSVTGTRIADNGRYDAWMLSGQDSLQAFATPDESITIGEPADANSVITAADYATRLSWTDKNYVQHTACDYTPCTNGLLQTGNIAAHSSVGPTIDGRQKPDIAAPGVLIISSLSGDATLCKGNASDDASCIDPMFITPDGRNYVATGTSMSSPHIAGVVALMLEANPTLDPSAVDAILRATARHDQFTGTAAWTPTFGAGKVDAYAAVQAAIQSAKPKPLPAPSPAPTHVVVPPIATTPVVPALAFHIVAVRTDPAGVKAGIDTAPLTHVRQGTGITLSIYTEYDALPRGARITVSWRVTRAGRPVFTHTTKTTVAAKAGEGSATRSSPSWNHVRFTPRQTGTYVFTGTVTVNSQSQHGSITFVVKKK